MEQGLISAMIVGKFSDTNLHLFSMRASILEKIHMFAVTVENPLATSTPSLNTSEFTLRQGLLSALNVGNFLVEALTLLHIREFTLVKGLLCVASVGKIS